MLINKNYLPVYSGANHAGNLILNEEEIIFSHSESDKITEQCDSMNEHSVRRICDLLITAGKNCENKTKNIQIKYDPQIKIIKKQMKNENIKNVLIELSQNSELIKSIFFK